MDEKEIINICKDLISMTDYKFQCNYTTKERNQAIQELLDLYHKQQKEIEMLKIIHDTYKKEIENIDARYISKNKIKELLYLLEKEDNERLDYLGKIVGVNGLYPDLTYIKIKNYIKKLI